MNFQNLTNQNCSFFKWAVGLCLLLWGLPVYPHTASENNLQLLVDGDELIFNITLNMEVLDRLDSNRDGFLGRDELRAQRAKYEAYLTETLIITDQNDTRGDLFFNDVMTNGAEAAANQDRVEHARMFRRYRFSEPLQELHLNLLAFSPMGEPFRVTMVDQNQISVWTLSPEYPELTVYLGERKLTSQILGWVGVGMRHILLGLDHLLVLLILVFGCLSFWRILGLATAFTLGHSLTLASAYLGWLVLPGAWVEIAIAMTLVYAAARRLSNGGMASRENWLVVVFIGLIHGFGFAGSFAHYPVSLGSEMLTLIGFNIGVEIGQLLALVPIALASWLIYRTTKSRRPAQALSFGVLAAGMFYTVTRIPVLLA